MSVLEITSASSFYGDFQALHEVSLAVEDGETVAIIGANGAGKSTLLGMIAGLLPTGRGGLAYRSEVIDRLPVHRRVERGISLVPEGRRVFASLSVLENLQVGAYRQRPGSWTVEAVFDLFPLLRELSDRSAAVLSGGEQQTLAIGRALMANPSLLLLDEVSLGLAPVIVGQLYERIRTIAAGGTTILLVEQNIDQALAVADRVYCLAEGRISLTGRPADLSRDAIVAAYFGI